MPDIEASAHFSPAEARLELACGILRPWSPWQDRRAELAGVDFFTFQRALGERGISTVTEPMLAERARDAQVLVPTVIVVADTSVLLNLCRVGQIEILSRLFRDVVIPPRSPPSLRASPLRFLASVVLTLPPWVRQQVAGHVPRCAVPRRPGRR